VDELHLICNLSQMYGRLVSADASDSLAQERAEDPRPAGGESAAVRKSVSKPL
jgi:hypothetical protein